MSIPEERRQGMRELKEQISQIISNQEKFSRQLDHLQGYVESEFGGTGLSGQPTEGNQTRNLRETREEIRILKTVVTIHDETLFGNKKESPGIKEELRNINTFLGYVKWLCATVGALVVEFIFRTFFHHPRP